ncbi:hypothetical protein [Streptomyces sp. CS014]|uniref:hypothetical protein n=1 Tax=Streptomyces sp. CS014 TaxID=2162707 RepID=UPI000D50A1D8|nr:hypothetical protein [Streptomyces sp. CS014]PVD04438.1 hypothetical protein DBP12_03165 [Streptomyces sp. CS014]
MNTTGAALGGIGAVVLGVILLAYQIGQWKGGDPTPKLHYFMGMTLAALLFLGGGILGAMGGGAAALGDGIGSFLLNGASSVDVTGQKPKTTGAEKVGLGGVVTGLALLAFYVGMIKSGRGDVKGTLIRGALTGVFLGAAGGLIGSALGLIRTSGNTVGDMILGNL